LLLLEDLNSARLVLIDPTEAQLIQSNIVARAWAWNKTKEKLVFSDGFTIEVYDVATHTRQTVTRLSEPVTDVRWYAEGDVIVYATPTRVTAHEVDPQNIQNQVQLAQMHVDTFWIDAQGNRLYVLGTLDGVRGVYERRLQD
jgi:hypothetical protein